MKLLNSRILFVILLATSSASLRAQVDCSVRLSYRSVTSGSSLCLEGTYPNASVLSSAAGNWNQRCDAGNTTPFISVGGCSDADIRINVVYQSGVSDNSNKSCGTFLYAEDDGVMSGGTIILYEKQMSSTGVVSACAGWATDTLTHELGHALGLKDVGDTECTGHIMGRPPSEGAGAIYGDDCSEVNRLWTTEREQQNLCNRGCWTTCENGVCPPQPITTVPTPCQTSPILIDLDNNGFHLAGLDEAVGFDIDGDGTANRISWTAAGTLDAFLVLDRNANGTIDDGRELFGTATPLAAGGTAANGYEALRELDDVAYGGNGDTMVDASDAAWDLLAVWIDADHDAISDPHELATLASFGIAAFDTGYKRASRRDEHGNGFRFRSVAYIRDVNGRLTPSMTYDVFFVEGPPER